MASGTGGKRHMRRAEDHVHPDLWEKTDHYRFEAEVKAELEKLEKSIEKLTTRITLMIGGLMLVAFLLPIIAPFIRLWLDLPTTTTP